MYKYVKIFAFTLPSCGNTTKTKGKNKDLVLSCILDNISNVWLSAIASFIFFHITIIYMTLSMSVHSISCVPIYIHFFFSSSLSFPLILFTPHWHKQTLKKIVDYKSSNT